MRETATAQIALGDNGILVVRIHEGMTQKIADARENLDGALAESNGKRRPLLVDVTKALPVDAETRHFYSGEKLLIGFSALVLLVEASPLGLMMGNVYFRVARPGIPTHLFTNEVRAVEWLRGYIE